jgi:DNA-3-methyladenine glycosylase II
MADDGTIQGEVHAAGADADAARRQALAALSLDYDGAGWAELGAREPVIGELQRRYHHLRPVLFHSPYEAAAAFVIGHRISIRQTRAIRARISAELGLRITVDGHEFAAFPTPSELLAAETLPGVGAAKTERLRAVARAAQAGRLDRDRLRALHEEVALAELRELPGIGEFFSQGILHRGAGSADGLTYDELTRWAAARAYDLESVPDHNELRELAERWRPYRMWTVVLLHFWAGRELGARRRHARAGRAGRDASPLRPRAVTRSC